MKRQLESDHPEQSLSVIFGTHNKQSVDTVISELQSNGLASKTSSGRLKLNDEVQGKVGIAQLYGQFSVPSTTNSQYPLTPSSDRCTLPIIGRLRVPAESQE